MTSPENSAIAVTVEEANPSLALSVPGAILEIGMHSTESGGLDRFFHGLVSSLARGRILHEAFVFGDPSGTRSRVTCLGPVTLSGWERLRLIRCEAKRFLSGTQTSVVVTHFAFYALPIIDLLFRMPHVVHFQGPWSGESAAEGQSAWIVFAKRQIERLVYRSARRLIVLSSAFRDLLVSDFGIESAKIAVIPGAIETSAFSPVCSRDQARARLKWPADRRIVLCVRRLVQRMGLEQLVQAMTNVRNQCPQALLLIAGKGPLSSKLAEQIAAAGLSDQVRLLGFVSEEDLPFAYRAADLSIVPSQSLEGFGLITLESLAAGTPVLVTPVGGLPETVERLSRDLILPGASPDDLAGGLINALIGRINLPAEAECHDYVRRNFDWSVITPRILEVYRSAMQIDQQRSVAKAE